jgi:Lrp/AsnC family transcriptional regulator
MDRTDKKILNLLQQNCSLSTAEIAEQIGLSTTPCWRRIQNLEKSGVIQKRVALLDRKSINLGVDVFVAIKTRHHNAEWLDAFAEAVSAFSEVVEFYRMSGDIDYLMRVVVPDINAYDRFYKRLIEKVDIQDVSSSFAMEQIKYTTALPVDYA